MTSEGSDPGPDKLILPFTSKTEQSIAQNKQKNFYLGITSKKRT